MRTAEARCSAGSPVRGSGFHTLSVSSTAAKTVTLRMNTQVGPAAAMTKPATAGPTAIAALIPAELSVIAPAKSERGTSPGMIAIHAGAASAVRTPSAAVRLNTVTAEWDSDAEINAKAPATSTEPAWANTMIRFRLKMSARAPARRASRNAGRARAIWREATTAGESVMSVSIQAPANPFMNTASWLNRLARSTTVNRRFLSGDHVLSLAATAGPVESFGVGLPISLLGVMLRLSGHRRRSRCPG